MSSKKKVLGNSVLYTFSSLLIKAFNFILLPIYTTYLSPEDYGITNLVNSFYVVASFIIAFSLYSAVVRFYADYKQDIEKLRRFYGTVIVFVFFSGVIFFSLGFLFQEILVSIFFDGVSFFPMIFIALLTLIFIPLHSIHQNILQGMQLGKKLTLINIVVFFIQVSLNLLFIAFFELGAAGVLISTLLVNIGYFFYLIYDLTKYNLVIFCIDLNLLKSALKYSIPLMPHNLSTHIASLTSRIFINYNGTLASVGLFSVATQISILIDMVQSSVNKAFTPWFYEMMNIRGREKNIRTKEEIKSFSNYLLLIYSFLYLFIGLFSQEVIIFMTNDQYVMAWTIIPILVVAYSIKSIYYFFVNILFYYKSATKKLFIATLTGSFADIFLAYFFVSLYGMYGAAISFLLAKIIVVIIVVVLSKRYDDIGYRVIEMLKIIIPSLIFMGIGLFFSYTKYITVINVNNLVYKFFIIFAYLIFVSITNRKIVKDLITVLKNIISLKGKLIKR